jgi:putative acetyltransferase
MTARPSATVCPERRADEDQVGASWRRSSPARVSPTSSPLVFLEGDPAYYRRFGFRAAGDLGCATPSVRIAEQAFQLVTLPSYETWMHGALVYPGVFRRYDAVGLRDSAHE